MTEYDKQLLLTDLCARLPYNVKIHIEGHWFYDEEEPVDTTLTTAVLEHLINDRYSIKPYLRPMSSMTEEEKNELNGMAHEFGNDWFDGEDKWFVSAKYQVRCVNFYYEHHLDCYGLIPLGLAIEVTEKNNPYND